MSDQNQEEVLDLEAPDEEIALDFEKVRPKSGHKIDKARRKELMAKRFVFNSAVSFSSYSNYCILSHAHFPCLIHATS